KNLGDVYPKLASQAYGKALQLDASNTGAQNKLSLVRELVREPGAKPAAVAAAPVKETPKESPTQTAAVEPKAPAKPAAKAGTTGDVLKAVNGWAQAWSKKDVDGYLAYYAKDFKTPGGEAGAEWEKGRRTRIEAPKPIAVVI